MNYPSVSVCITAFNIENYVRRAINSVLSQKTNFEFEIVIGEDKSNDNTLQILHEYSLAYPNRFRVLSNETNLGMMSNFIKTIEACKGNYIAILDGDDYWINPNKLQMQFDMLESKSDLILCWHDAIIVNSLDEHVSSYSERFKGRSYLSSFDLYNVVRWKVLGATSSIFFRNVISPFPDWAYSLYGTDALLFLRCKQAGMLIYIPQKMSAYRMHTSSMEASFDRYTKSIRNINEEKVLARALYPNFQDHFYRKMIWNTFYISAISLKDFMLLNSFKYFFSFLALFPRYAYHKIKFVLNNTCNIFK